MNCKSGGCAALHFPAFSPQVSEGEGHAGKELWISKGRHSGSRFRSGKPAGSPPSPCVVLAGSQGLAGNRPAGRKPALPLCIAPAVPRDRPIGSPSAPRIVPAVLRGKPATGLPRAPSPCVVPVGSQGRAGNRPAGTVSAAEPPFLAAKSRYGNATLAHSGTKIARPAVLQRGFPLEARKPRICLPYQALAAIFDGSVRKTCMQHAGRAAGLPENVRCMPAVRRGCRRMRQDCRLPRQDCRPMRQGRRPPQAAGAPLPSSPHLPAGCRFPAIKLPAFKLPAVFYQAASSSLPSYRLSAGSPPPNCRRAAGCRRAAVKLPEKIGVGAYSPRACFTSA